MTEAQQATQSKYWRDTKRLSSALLICWGLLTFGFLFFARELANVQFFGWPLSFYMAAQGLTISYVVILAVYSFGMHWIQRTERKA